MRKFDYFTHAIPFAAFFLLTASIAVYSYLTNDVLWALFAGAVAVVTIYAYVDDLFRELDKIRRARR